MRCVGRRFTPLLASGRAARATASPIGSASYTITSATVRFESGVVLRDQGEWEAGVSEFLRAVRLMERDLTIGTPCP